MTRRWPITGCWISLLLSCGMAWAQIKPVVAHRDVADATADFKLPGVPVPSANDKATGKKFVIIDGDRDGNSASIEALTDGLVPSTADAPEDNFFFASGTDGGRLRLHLGTAIDVKQVNTYSWHTNGRRTAGV